MFNNKIMDTLAIVFVGLCGYRCLKAIPERAKLIEYDEDYVKNATLNVRRSKRGGDYIVNLNFTLLQYVGNNVTISIFFYEYLHNEYRPSFIELHYKLCDLLLKDKFLGVITRRTGLRSCPLRPGVYALKNLYFNDEIPSVWPFEKGMVQVVVAHDAKPKGVIGKGEVMISIINNVPAKRKMQP